MPYDDTSVPAGVVHDPTLAYEHTRGALTTWVTPEKDADTLAARLIERVGRGLPRGVRWDPHGGALFADAVAVARYGPQQLVKHFDFVWSEEFDIFTNELDYPRDRDSKG